MPTSSSTSAVNDGVGAPLLLRWFSVRDVENPIAPAAAASRAMHAHLGDVFRRRGFAVRAAFAHHVDAQRRVRQLRGDVHVEAALRQIVEILRERLPVPRQTFVQRRAGNVFDAFHQFDQQVVVGAFDRREADAAVAHHDGRHAVVIRRRHPRRPRRLAVVVRVNVDEARRHDRAVAR